MYTDQQIRVLWNGEFSTSFSVSNGVKQGAIISPILFCVYLDVLLIELKKAGLGCFVGNWFAAALAYANDILLLAPSTRAMRRMLLILQQNIVLHLIILNLNVLHSLVLNLDVVHLHLSHHLQQEVSQ